MPPYAVVQCVEGPRHTRGTPPNVVETDPLTWIRLATGRLAWADALAEAKVSASGERADIGGLLAGHVLAEPGTAGARRIRMNRYKQRVTLAVAAVLVPVHGGLRRRDGGTVRR